MAPQLIQALVVGAVIGAGALLAGYLLQSYLRRSLNEAQDLLDRREAADRLEESELSRRPGHEELV